MYTQLQFRWLMCIEIMYIWLCSFFPEHILKHMKWYVGSSMIYDHATQSFRDKQFYVDWGIHSFYMFMAFASSQHTKDIQCRHLYIKGMWHVSNTTLLYIPNEMCVHTLLYRHHRQMCYSILSTHWCHSCVGDVMMVLMV